jgi:uncharacterized membrane protein
MKLKTMKTNNTRLNFSLLTTTLTGLTLLSLTSGSALAANWTITDLGALGAPGNLAFESRAYNINNAGQVAGRGIVFIDGVRQNHYVVWSNGTQIDLGIRINSSLVDAAPINDAGQVAGVIEDEGYRPFLWQTGVVTRLPVLPGLLTAGVASINASGTVVGWNQVWRGGGQPRLAVRWEGGILTELDTDWRPAVAINDSGAIAISGGPSHVLTGGATNVVEVPGHPSTVALDLNNAGQVCGTTVDGHHAFLWQGGFGTLLPGFPSGVSAQSEAVALNNLGHAVGWAANNSGMNPPVLWRDGTLTSLNDLPEVQAAGWWLMAARDINDHDQIVGIGSHGGLVTAFLLSPVTAPSPFSLTITRIGTNVVVSFPTEASFSYSVQSKPSLAETNWNLLATLPGNGSTKSVTDPATNAARFYRVLVP